jgi:glycerol transport system ATP-binding protein
MNFLPCTLAGQAVQVDHVRIDVAPETAARAAKAKGVLELGIRPMHLEVHLAAVEGAVPVTVKSLEDQGSFKILTAAFNGHIVRARMPEDRPVPSEKAWLTFPPSRTRLFADERLVG